MTTPQPQQIQQLTEEQEKRWEDRFSPGRDRVPFYILEDDAKAHLATELQLQQQELEAEKNFDWNVKSINRVIKNYLLPRMNNAIGKISDGYHTFNELYEFRKLYNAALFNEWAKQGLYDVHKSTKHHDGQECFGGGWFIVMATLPTGQISNHYELKDWDLFRCREQAVANVWDGHTAQDVAQRLLALLQKEGI